MVTLSKRPNSQMNKWRLGPLNMGGKESNPPIPPQPPLGPLDVVGRVDGFFTNFSQSFNLESDCAVVGLCCYYKGDPVITIMHGDDVLTIEHQERNNGWLSLIAVGHGLVIEEALVSITATGGTLDGGAMRIHEIQPTVASGTGWVYGAQGVGREIAPATPTGTIGGIIKGALVTANVDRYHTMAVTGAENVWSGFTSTGTLIGTDTTVAGPWVLGAGWSIDGDDFVHTGPRSSISIGFPSTVGSTSARMEAVIDTGGEVEVGRNGLSGDRYQAGNHYIATGSGGAATSYNIWATGVARIKGVTVVENAHYVSWLFCSTPAVDDQVITFTQPYRPEWAYSLVEATCAG